MSILRPCSAALTSFLTSLPPGWKGQADLFQFVPAGRPVLNWAAWDTDLVFNGTTYVSKAPWITRSKWSVTNTMQVPSLDVVIRAGNGEFNGGAQLKQQIHNGLFDGATMLLTRVYMQTPGNTSALGGVVLFSGVVAKTAITGSKITITCKGKNNLLDQNAPRNVYQITCAHNFCDLNCTLNPAAFTSGYTVGPSPKPSAIFIPWNGAAPAIAALYANGQIAFTSGPASGQSRTIMNGNSQGLNLAYPLYEAPNPGDSFTALQGCDKTQATCTNTYNNLQHFRGYPYVPPPDTSF